MNNKVSVAMTTYNSSKYVAQQVESILKNLRENDELIISDDCSTDETKEILDLFSKKDKRIKVFYQGKNLGINNNYVFAIQHCSGDIIFLSDGDDIWFDNKIKKVLDVFGNNKKTLLVQHDCGITDENLNVIYRSFNDYYRAKSGLIKNWLRSSYSGARFAFRRELLKYILPLPKHIPTYYDDWFGLMADKHGKVVFINDVLSLWRRYEGANSTGFIQNSANTNRIASFLRKTRERIKVRTIKLMWILFK